MVQTYIMSVSFAYSGLKMQYPITRALAATIMTDAASGLKVLLKDTASLHIQISKYIIAKITEKVNQKFKLVYYF
jgi:hypothetical protein